MRRIGLLVAILALLLLAGLGMLVARALDSVERERAMRHEVLAERVFDELETQLTELTEREEARPFLQYRFFYVPEGQVTGNPSLSRSPLSEVPAEDWLLGWFQLDPDGGISTPFEPDDPELAGETGWEPADDLDGRVQRLREVAEALPVQAEDRRSPEEGPLLANSDKAAVKAPAPDPTPKPEPVREVKEKLEKQKKEDDDGVVGLDVGLLGTKSAPSTGKKREVLAQSSDPYGIGSLNKGATRRGERQQRVTKSSADNVRSYQFPERNEEILRGDAPLPEVEWKPDGVAAVQAKQEAEQWDAAAAAEADGVADAGGDEQALKDAELFNADLKNAGEERRRDAGGERERAAEPVEIDEVSVAASAEEAVDGPAAEEAIEDDWAPEQKPNRLGRRKRSVPPPVFGRASKSTAASPAAAPAEEVAQARAEPQPDDAGIGVEGDDLIASRTEGGRFGTLDERSAAREPNTTETASDPPPPPVVTEVPQVTPAPVRQAPVPTQRRPAKPTKPNAQTAPKPAPEDGEVDVEISPFRGHRVDDETMVLYRSVRIGEVVYVQGLALLLPRLAQWLEGEVLDGSDIQGFLDLAWNADAPAKSGRGAPLADFTFAHTFAEPFTSLGVTSYVRALPEPRGSGRTWILQLTALLVLVGAIGLLALWRMVSVVVHFAERRSNFVAAVSHELKTPLTAIRMYAEMLRDGYVLNEEKRDEYYATMAAESERLSRLIQNVLELSNLEKGASGGGEIVTGDVRPVLEEAVRVLERHARDRGFAVVLEVPDDLPAVRYERDGLLQVLINLVDNGIKFSKDADPREVVIQAVPRSGGVTLQVRDHGPGVPQRQLKSIFQPFYRGERELTRRTKGTGIGLALVKGIVDRMGGSVSARNHPDGGFEVRVALVG